MATASCSARAIAMESNGGAAAPDGRDCATLAGVTRAGRTTSTLTTAAAVMDRIRLYEMTLQDIAIPS